ncbi:MAG: MATE family efflux transporter [Clostridia bacterium]|nr:MATE family efflux transporter [Clostridia bacterium]
MSEKYVELTEQPVEKLVCKLAFPTIISMLITSFYNMADTFFVGKINTSATGAVGIVFTLMAVIQACGFFFGHGSGNYISRQLGRQNKEEASRMASIGFFSSLLFGIAFMMIGLLFLKPLAVALGSTQTILPYAMDYLKLILIGAPYMTASLVLNNQLRFQGNAMYAMIGILTGAVLNIALDPLFIFVFKMGIKGAALATIISQLVSFCMLLYGTHQGENLHIHIQNFKPTPAYYLEICRGGAPSLLRQGLASVAGICLNFSAGVYGDVAIAAMSITNRVMMFAGSALIGFGQGFQPVCGFNYGAGLYERVKKAFFFCIKSSFFVLIALSVLGGIFAPTVIAVFRKDPEVIEIGTNALRFQCLTFPFMGWVVLSNMMLQNIGKVWKASFLAIARQGLFFIPLILILPRYFGLLGIEMTQPLSDTISFVCSIPLQLGVLRKMSSDAAPKRTS